MWSTVSLMRGLAVIATHHKTGTVWMQAVFRRVARKLKLRFVAVPKNSLPEAVDFEPPAIVFDDHSEFRNCQWLLERPETRILHLIRDPRDVIVSAAHYHCKSDEPWLKWPRAEFDGLSYQEVINRLPDERSRFLFEMKNSAGRTIEAMRTWQYDRANSLEYKYEDLISDPSGKLMGAAFRHLGFERSELQICRKAFRKNSLQRRVKSGNSVHIRSGAPREWLKWYDRDLAVQFLRQFGDVLVELGYEQDDRWADIPEGSPVPSDRELEIGGPGHAGELLV